MVYKIKVDVIAMALDYAQESIWFDKWRYDEAEAKYYEKQYGGVTALGSLANQIAKAREEIQNSLATVSDLEKTVLTLTKRITAIECAKPTIVTAPSPVKRAAPPAASKSSTKVEDDNDEDIDLFGSDDDDEMDAEAARVREERLKQYAEKKSKKPGPIAKSSVLLDCKPWDDETDLVEMEKVVRSIKMDGLLWGAAKFVPLAFGIKKLSILCTVEDEKVSIDDLIEKIQEFEDFVQSVDIAAFNKI
ncbi:Elongation factor 1-delta [Armadillidium vulgare]|nr:Elongation factor 1-delta [Armadillidium vulgare]